MKLKSEQIVTNTSTGEVTTIQRIFNTKVESTEEFYLTFVQVMATLMKVKSMNDIKVLTHLCVMMKYDENRVDLSVQTRKEMCDILGMHTNHVSNSLKSLKDLEIITGEKGTYFVNPVFFWKGTKATRDKLIKEKGLELRIEFTNREE